MPHPLARRSRRRGLRIGLIATAVPLLVGGLVTVALASPPQHGGPVRPIHRPTGTAGRHQHPSASPSANPVTPDPDCTLEVPADALTARGLATPYRLTATNPAAGPCHEANAAQSAFVQATIYDPATGRLSVYDPLVIDARSAPAASPVVPRLPANAVVGLWFGFDGNNLTLRPAAPDALRTAQCVNGLNGSVFGQFAYCDAPRFFNAVNQGIATHRVTVPELGTAADGEPCPTTRDFSIVDQDQSDNVTTRYLAGRDGRTAQDEPNAAARMRGARVLANPSDNALVDDFVDPALGCTPWRVTDLAGGPATTSLALDELQAAADQAAPAALVPLSDPMATIAAGQNERKTDLYRAGVDQAAVPAGQTPTAYCQDMDAIQTARLKLDHVRFAAAPSPDPATSDSLLTFLAGRLYGSFTNLGCAAYGLVNPIATEQTGSDGVLVSFTFAGDAVPTAAMSASPNPRMTSSAGASAGRGTGASPSAMTSQNPGTSGSPSPSTPEASP